MRPVDDRDRTPHGSFGTASGLHRTPARPTPTATALGRTCSGPRCAAVTPAAHRGRRTPGDPFDRSSPRAAADRRRSRAVRRGHTGGRTPSPASDGPPTDIYDEPIRPDDDRPAQRPRPAARVPDDPKASTPDGGPDRPRTGRRRRPAPSADRVPDRRHGHRPAPQPDVHDAARTPHPPTPPRRPQWRPTDPAPTGIAADVVNAAERPATHRTPAPPPAGAATTGEPPLRPARRRPHHRPTPPTPAAALPTHRRHAASVADVADAAERRPATHRAPTHAARRRREHGRAADPAHRTPTHAVDGRRRHPGGRGAGRAGERTGDYAARRRRATAGPGPNERRPRPRHRHAASGPSPHPPAGRPRTTRRPR